MAHLFKCLIFSWGKFASLYHALDFLSLGISGTDGVTIIHFQNQPILPCLVKDSWAEASTEVLINPNPPPTKKNREKDDKDMLMVELRLVLGLLTTSYWLFVLVIKLFQDL